MISLSTDSQVVTSVFRITPDSSTSLAGVAIDNAGCLWMSSPDNNGSYALFKFDPKTGIAEKVKSVVATKTAVGNMASTVMGKLYYVIKNNNAALGCIDPASGEVSELAVPPNTAGRQINGITCQEKDDVIWFTVRSFEAENEQIRFGVMSYSPESGEFADYLRLTTNLEPPTEAITTDDSGNIWYAAMSGLTLDELDPVNNGIRVFGEPLSQSSMFGGVASGSEGEIWFTDPRVGHGAIGRIDPSTGDIAEYSEGLVNMYPKNIVADRNGAIWFTEKNAHYIGNITAEGIISEIATDIQIEDIGYDEQLISSSDGSLWGVYSNGYLVHYEIVSEGKRKNPY